MEVIVLGERDVYELLSIADCITVMEGAFRTVAAGKFAQPQRLIAWLPDGRGAIGSMPAYLGDPDTLAVKVIAVFPADHLVVAINSAWPTADEDASWVAELAFVRSVQAAARAAH